ncbi:hypothetical protein AC579_3309 [Pseudocercospora musae]|uniref:Uncharacterized protein n=1 Tax=Pseudocercospora musae TaxID=113226 RepID=A0A139IA41_9PEZI|nr:hypothetical protein AC579_3309 [Pseudocercospora musae]
MTKHGGGIKSSGQSVTFGIIPNMIVPHVRTYLSRHSAGSPNWSVGLFSPYGTASSIPSLGSSN